ncbi:MAG: hypothetical protein JWR67_2791 [Mucilaginibacter sp.]|nr:hypothetical protein [Mucilaginibacter sp.]
MDTRFLKGVICFPFRNEKITMHLKLINSANIALEALL